MMLMFLVKCCGSSWKMDLLYMLKVLDVMKKVVL